MWARSVVVPVSCERLLLPIYPPDLCMNVVQTAQQLIIYQVGVVRNALQLLRFTCQTVVEQRISTIFVGSQLPLAVASSRVATPHQPN